MRLQIAYLILSTPEQVRVYTRGGNYVGFEQSTGGWTIIYSGLVDQLGVGQPTFLGRFLTNVVVPAGAYQSFYVVADGGLVDSVGSREFTAFASDNCVQICGSFSLVYCLKLTRARETNIPTHMFLYSRRIQH